MTDEEIRAISKIFIVACGSAYHTGVTAKYIFENVHAHGRHLHAFPSPGLVVDRTARKVTHNPFASWD